MRKSKVWALILTGTLAVTVLPVQAGTLVQAEDGEVHTLANPTLDEDGNTIWDCVYFGNYYQSDTTGETKEPIKWRVLSITGNDAYLIADKALDVKPWNETQEGVTWENCTLRSWLNGYGSGTNICAKDFGSDNFINTAFSQTEQSAIFTTNVINQHDPFENSPSGNDTEDKIYLLSHTEALRADYGFIEERYTSETREVKITPYANEKLDWESNYYLTPGWWLRSHGDDTYPDNWSYYGHYAAYVFSSGFVYCNGEEVDDDFTTVRPVLHLNTQNTDVYTYVGTVNSGKQEIEETTAEEETLPEESTEETTKEEQTAESVTVSVETTEEITTIAETDEQGEDTSEGITTWGETEPISTDVEVTIPETTLTEVVESTMSEITKPEVTIPEVTTPEITTPEVTTPQETTIPEETTSGNIDSTDAVTTSEKDTTAGNNTTTALESTIPEQTTVTENITASETSTVAESTSVSETSTAVPVSKTDSNAPGKVAIKKIQTKKKSSKAVKVSLKKMKSAKGYEVRVLRKKKAKKSLVRKYTQKTTVTLTSVKLKNKKKLFVKARAYVLDGNGKKVYGKWSKVKKVKVK